MTTGLALVDTASVMRIALVGIGVGGTLTLSRLAEQADRSWSGTTLDIVDRPESLGRGSAFGTDIAAAAVNTSQHRLDALSPSLHSFRSWLESSGSPSTDLDTTPMSRSVYGDYLAATLAKAIDRLRDCGVRVRFYPMHATSVRPQGDGMAVLSDTAELPPADIAVVAPGVWSPPPPPTHHIVEAYPLSGLRTRLGDQRSVAVLGSGLTAVDVACALDDGKTRVHLLSRTGTLPRVQVEATQKRICARTSHRGRSHLLRGSKRAHREVGACAAGSRNRLVSDSPGPTFSTDAAHAAHWSDPLADPADLACHHTLSATNHALNTAFALLPEPERILLRESLGSKWFRYRVRIPLSRWRQLRAMQADGRLMIHGGVDARDEGLDDILADLGARPRNTSSRPVLEPRRTAPNWLPT